MGAICTGGDDDINNDDMDSDSMLGVSDSIDQRPRVLRIPKCKEMRAYALAVVNCSDSTLTQNRESFTLKSESLSRPERSIAVFSGD